MNQFQLSYGQYRAVCWSPSTWPPGRLHLSPPVSTRLHLESHLITYMVEEEQVEVVGLISTGLASTSTLHHLTLGWWWW